MKYHIIPEEYFKDGFRHSIGDIQSDFPATEKKGNSASTIFLQRLLERILKGQHEVIDGGLMDEVVSKSHIIKVFKDLAIYEKYLKF